MAKRKTAKTVLPAAQQAAAYAEARGHKLSSPTNGLVRATFLAGWSAGVADEKAASRQRARRAKAKTKKGVADAR